MSPIRTGGDICLSLVLLGVLLQIQRSEAGCTQGLPAITSASGGVTEPISARVLTGTQIIFSSSPFTECGQITAVKVRGMCTEPADTELQVQVWERKSTAYTRKNFANVQITAQQCLNNITNLTGLTGLGFKSGNFFGMYLPPRQQASFEIEVRDAPTGMIAPYKSSRIPQPTATISFQSQIFSAITAPQISVQVMCGCSTSNLPLPTSPIRPSGLSPLQNPQQETDSGVIAGIVVGGVVFIVVIIVMTIVSVIVCGKLAKTVKKKYSSSTKTKQTEYEDSSYYSIPLTENPGYTSVSKSKTNGIQNGHTILSTSPGTITTVPPHLDTGPQRPAPTESGDDSAYERIAEPPHQYSTLTKSEPHSNKGDTEDDYTYDYI